MWIMNFHVGEIIYRISQTFPNRPLRHFGILPNPTSHDLPLCLHVSPSDVSSNWTVPHDDLFILQGAVQMSPYETFPTLLGGQIQSLPWLWYYSPHHTVIDKAGRLRCSALRFWVRKWQSPICTSSASPEPVMMRSTQWVCRCPNAFRVQAGV